jgi:hypothetical protein
MEPILVAFLNRRPSFLLAKAHKASGAYLGAEPDELAYVSNATRRCCFLLSIYA